MSGMSSGSLQPTWYGHVTTARDALVLFEACLNGVLHHVPRRPHDRERSQLIRSGSVFVYEENASGIKRWTDGVPWSPSRILGNFLVYRELVKPFPPGEKKKANKRNKRMTKPGEPYPRPGSGDAPLSPTTPVRSDVGSENREHERALIGSLVDSYGFKEGGLVKKTMSVTVHGVQHHLVSYYKIEEALDGTLAPPSKDPRLTTTEPRPDLIARQNFRAPLDDVDEGAGDQMAHGQAGGYGYANSYGRPSLMMGGHQQHPGLSSLSMYPGMAYSSASHMQPGMHSYAPISTQSYYPSTTAITHPIVTKQEDYAGYGHSHHSSFTNSPTTPTDRPSSLPSPHQSQNAYAYRPSPISAALPRSNGLLDTPVSATEQKPLQSPGWGARSGSLNGVYAPTAAPTSNPSPSYTHSGSHWGLVSTSGQSLPRPESVWGSNAGSSHWSVQNNPMTTRHGSYQSATAQQN